MREIFNIELQQIFNRNMPIVIELGCGRNKTPGRIGIDRLNMPGVDIVADIEQGLPFFPDNSVDEIHSRSFFEHVENLEGLMREIVRVLKPDGTCHLFVPHFSNPYYYSDYTHNKFMGLYTFYYFVDDIYQLRRKVPNFYTDIRIRVVSQKLVIANPFKRLSLFKKPLEVIFNCNSMFQEFYEANLCWICPCYGLDLVFKADK
ncbi:MAG: methyltransferase domain-containing protein [Geobacter sp.]|nr:methyltransferase domain-containing protein [Geobacter sp.]